LDNPFAWPASCAGCKNIKINHTLRGGVSKTVRRYVSGRTDRMGDCNYCPRASEVVRTVVASMRNRKLVFVVDDDAATLRSIGRLLRQRGFETVLFPSAEAFDDHLDFERALCVIFDINLNGGRSGIELRHRLKDAGHAVPVIYMTGNDKPAVRAAALASGCLAYLLKPVSASSLIEHLERVSASAPT
jgi:CheY-like chemotaxis protein